MFCLRHVLHFPVKYINLAMHVSTWRSGQLVGSTDWPHGKKKWWLHLFASLTSLASHQSCLVLFNIGSTLFHLALGQTANGRPHSGGHCFRPSWQSEVSPVWLHGRWNNWKPSQQRVLPCRLWWYKVNIKLFGILILFQKLKVSNIAN